jgi:hypothetical protein
MKEKRSLNRWARVGLHSLRFGIDIELTSCLINPNFLADFN